MTKKDHDDEQKLDVDNQADDQQNNQSSAQGSQIDLTALELEIASLKEALSVAEDKTKRAEAELVNFKNRMEKEKIEFVKFASKKTILEFLTVLDTFQLALNFVPEDLKENAWVMGMQQVLRQFDMTLESLGVKRMKTVGEKIDYTRHEVLAIVDGEEDIIVREVQAGYTLQEALLRAAKVEVGKGD